MQDVQDISRYKLLVWEDIITTPNNLMINITTNVNSRKISFLGLDQPIQRLNRDVGFAHAHCCACNVVASLLPTYPPRNQSRSGHRSVDISQPQKTSNPSHFSHAVEIPGCTAHSKMWHHYKACCALIHRTEAIFVIIQLHLWSIDLVG